MGSSGFAALAVTMLVLAGCADDRGGEESDERPAPSSGPSQAVEMEQRGVIEVPGLAHSGVVVASAVTSDPGMVGDQLTIDRCEHIAPGRWEFAGVIDHTNGPDAVHTRVTFDHGGDVVISAGLRLDTTGSGAFTTQLDLGASFEQYEESTTCKVDDTSDGPAVTKSETPLDYVAPVGSFQALGIGATPAEPGTLAYQAAQAAWFEMTPPFADVWVPDRDAAVRLLWPDDPGSGSERIHYDGNCLSWGYRVDEVHVLQEAGCGRRHITSEPSTVEGFVLDAGEPASGIDPSLIMETAEARIVITGAADDIDAVATSLAPVGNAAYDADTVVPYTRDELVGAQFTDGGDGVANVRLDREIDHAEGTISIWLADVVDPCETVCATTRTVAVLEYEQHGRLVVERLGPGGEDCYGSAGGWSQGQGAEVLIVLADSTWEADVFVPERYGPPDFIDGIWYARFPDAATTVGVDVLGITDADGEPVSCFDA